MAKEQAQTETKKEEKKPEEPVEFLQRVTALKYPFADVTHTVKVIPRTEDNLLSLGFADANGRRQIVLTADKQVWAKIFQDGLDYINSK